MMSKSFSFFLDDPDIAAEVADRLSRYYGIPVEIGGSLYKNLIVIRKEYHLVTKIFCDACVEGTAVYVNASGEIISDIPHHVTIRS